jgi:Protein of unknown function (DUF3089)
VLADGTTEVERHQVAEDPPVDCFYVYPTTSFDQGPNSDFTPGESEEISTVYNQVARLTSTCRVFAPIYRQATISAIGGGGGAQDGPDPRTVAYGDVLDAFRYYVANESDGRGFVLVGGSQGAGLLNRLIAEEIDDEPLLRDRLVSAYLLGSSVAVPEGDVAGGSFDNVPLCETDDQTGCVISYQSFRSTAPPPPNSIFGRTNDTGQPAACANPGDLSGGPAPLEPYFRVDQPQGALLGGTAPAQPFADPARTAEITTPWVVYPDLVEGECVSDGTYTYLSLVVHGDPAEPRTDDIGGDLTPSGACISSTPTSPWGTSKTWSPPRPRRTRPAADGDDPLGGRLGLVAGRGGGSRLGPRAGGDHALARGDPPADVPGADQAGAHDDAGK